MKPKYIEEICDVCGHKLVHYQTIDQEAWENEWFCETCKDIIPDLDPEWIAANLQPNPENCVDINAVTEDLPEEFRNLVKELKDKFPEDTQILISPEAIKDLILLQQQEESEKKKLN